MVVGIDRTGDDGVAQAGRGIDDGRPPPAVDRVGSEHDARRGGVNHPLNDDRERHALIVEPAFATVSDCPFVPE